LLDAAPARLEDRFIREVKAFAVVAPGLRMAQISAARAAPRTQHVTEQPRKSLPQFYVTAPTPCPYLPGRMERKIFTHLLGDSARVINDALTAAGFRRSQHIAYKPACDACRSCVSVRIPVFQFEPSRGQKRILKVNEDVTREAREAKASMEQFSLLRSYLDDRHPSGGMSEMTLLDYSSMVEETPISTNLVEYRVNGPNRLVACALSDRLGDGVSMVYSFYSPDEEWRSLGTHMILDHVAYAHELGLPYLYLGYWVGGCRKMDYKRRFRPLEALGPQGWYLMNEPEE
jgi:arginine-tRNA-protein transferase